MLSVGERVLGAIMKKFATKFKLIDASGVASFIEVFIEAPQQEAVDEFSCSFKIEPKMPNLQKIFGIDEQQAFALAVGICETFLSSLITKGGELFYPDGKKYSRNILL